MHNAKDLMYDMCDFKIFYKIIWELFWKQVGAISFKFRNGWIFSASEIATSINVPNKNSFSFNTFNTPQLSDSRRQ